jgi:hypothetical protein
VKLGDRHLRVSAQRADGGHRQIGIGRVRRIQRGNIDVIEDPVRSGGPAGGGRHRPPAGQ